MPMMMPCPEPEMVRISVKIIAAISSILTKSMLESHHQISKFRHLLISFLLNNSILYFYEILSDSYFTKNILSFSN